MDQSPLYKASGVARTLLVQTDTPLDADPPPKVS